MGLLGLELAPGGLAAVGQQVVVLAERIQLHDEIAGDLITLHAKTPSASHNPGISKPYTR